MITNIKENTLKKDRIHWNKSYLPVFLFLLIGVLAENGIFLSIHLFMSYDELPSMALPLSFANSSWIDILTDANFHGFGASLIMTPFISLCKTGTTIYHLFQIENILARSLCCLLAVMLLVNHFQLDKKTAVWIALLCNGGTLDPTDGRILSVHTEVYISLLLLTVSFFLLKYLSATRKEISYCVFIALIMGYGVFIHARSIIILVCFLFVLACVFILEKKQRKKLLLLTLVIIITFFAFNYLNDFIIELLYNSHTTEIDNTISGAVKFKLFTAISTLFSYKKAKLTTFASLLATFSVESVGFWWLFVSLNINFILSELLAYFKTKRPVSRMVYISLFSLLCWLIMNLSLALYQYRSLLNGSLRFLTYFRYAKPFCYIIVMCGCAIWHKRSFNKIFVSLSSLIASVASTIYMNMYIIPIFETVEMGTETWFHSWQAIYQFLGMTEFEFVKFLGTVSVIMSVLFTGILLAETFLKKSFLQVALCLYLCIGLIWNWGEYSYWKTRDISHQALVNASSLLLQNRTFDAGTIYALDGAIGAQRYLLKFALPNEKITSLAYGYDISQLDLSDGLLITNYDPSGLVDYTVQLDDNEWASTSSEMIYQKILEQESTP